MKQKSRIPLWLPLLLAAVIGGLVVETVQAGGWAVVTLEKLPATVVANRPFTVRFIVRQHGVSLLSGLSPMVTAEHVESGESVSALAAEAADKGEYAATITLPLSGQWRWSIEAFSATHPMPPLTAQAAALPVPEIEEPGGFAWPLAAGIGGALVALGMAAAWRRQPSYLRLVGMVSALVVSLAGFTWGGQQPLSLAAQSNESEMTPSKGSLPAVVAVDQGEALFVAKGCITCHQNHNVTIAGDLSAIGYPIGPNLTTYKNSAEFLRLWLADPSRVKPGTRMPDLNLNDAEIETLIPFLLRHAE